MDRRTFIKRGVIGGAILMLGGGVGLALAPTKEQGAPTGPLAFLEPRGFQVLVAIAKRVLPAGADAIAVAQGVDTRLSYAAPEAQADFNKLLMLFENALPGLIFDGRVMPFTRLSAEAQDGVLRSWRDSNLTLRRTGYQALRKICLSTYWAEESSWQAIGYSPPSGLNAMAYDDSKLGAEETGT